MAQSQPVVAVSSHKGASAALDSATAVNQCKKNGLCLHTANVLIMSVVAHCANASFYNLLVIHRRL